MRHKPRIYSCYVSVPVRTSGPRREEGRFLLEYLRDVGRYVFLVHDEAEHVFVKPSVGRDEVSVVGSGSPAVFNHPFEWLAVFVEVYGDEGRGVGRRAGICAYAVGLVRTEVGSHKGGVVRNCQCRRSAFTVEELAHVA